MTPQMTPQMTSQDAPTTTTPVSQDNIPQLSQTDQSDEFVQVEKELPIPPEAGEKEEITDAGSSNGLFSIVNGLLYLTDGHPGSNLQLCILHDHIIRLVHSAAHLGIRKTFQAVASRYYFPKMSKSIASFVNRCQLYVSPTKCSQIRMFKIRLSTQMFTNSNVQISTVHTNVHKFDPTNVHKLECSNFDCAHKTFTNLASLIKSGYKGVHNDLRSGNYLGANTCLHRISNQDVADYKEIQFSSTDHPISIGGRTRWMH